MSLCFQSDRGTPKGRIARGVRSEYKIWFNRSRRPTESQPPESFSHPVDIVNSMSESMLDGRPPTTQERVIHMKKILGGIAAAIAMVLF